LKFPAIVSRMTLLHFKLFSALLIFVAAFLVGYIPARRSLKHSCRIHIYEAIASGIFLGAALFHMLPDAIEGFEKLNGTPFQYSIALATLTYVTLVIIERGSSVFMEHHLKEKLTGYLLTLVLSIHSIIAGAALGISTTLGAAMVIFIAIMAHKSCASFAMVIKLRQVLDNRKHIMMLLLIFSLMTPIGILAASSVSDILADHAGIKTEATLNAITAGTFFYSGTLDHFGRQLKPQRLINRFWKFVALISGMTAMGLIAIWI